MDISSHVISTKYFFMHGYDLSEETANIKWMEKKQVWWTRSKSVYEEHLFFTGNGHLSQENIAKTILQVFSKVGVIDCVICSGFSYAFSPLVSLIALCLCLWRAEQRQVCAATAAGPKAGPLESVLMYFLLSQDNNEIRWASCSTWVSWENTLFLLLLAVVPSFFWNTLC